MTCYTQSCHAYAGMQQLAGLPKVYIAWRVLAYYFKGCSMFNDNVGLLLQSDWYWCVQPGTTTQYIASHQILSPHIT